MLHGGGKPALLSHLPHRGLLKIMSNRCILLVLYQFYCCFDQMTSHIVLNSFGAVKPREVEPYVELEIASLTTRPCHR